MISVFTLEEMMSRENINIYINNIINSGQFDPPLTGHFFVNSLNVRPPFNKWDK